MINGHKSMANAIEDFLHEEYHDLRENCIEPSTPSWKTRARGKKSSKKEMKKVTVRSVQMLGFDPDYDRELEKFKEQMHLMYYKRIEPRVVNPYAHYKERYND